MIFLFQFKETSLKGTHNRQWVCPSGSWRSVCPCWKPHRWVSAHPPPGRPCGSCWTWLSSHHCLPTDREHIWQFSEGTDSLGLWHCHSYKEQKKRKLRKKKRQKQPTVVHLGEYRWQISRCNNWCCAWSVINKHIHLTLCCKLSKASFCTCLIAAMPMQHIWLLKLLLGWLL